MHLHTIASDGLHTALAVLSYAKLIGVTVVSITDHNEISASLRGEKIAKALNLIYYPGVELMFHVKGRVYELLAYFNDGQSLRNFYKKYRFTNGFMPHYKNVDEVVSLVKEYKGVVVSPHPFGRKGIYRNLKNANVMVDGVEILNAFTEEKRNGKAAIHKTKNDNAKTLGSADMHFFLQDIGRVYTKIESNQKITKELVWKCLLGIKDEIKFIPIGNSFSKRKILFQKPLCAVVYVINWPWLYIKYRFRKQYKNC